MAVTHEQAAKWTQMDWMNRVKHVKPSSDGAVGVLFVWAVQSPIEKLDPTTTPASFIVKPMPSSGKSTQLAEKVLTKVVGAKSTESIEIQKASDGGRGIMHWVDWLVRNQDATMILKKKAFEDAGVLLLQKCMTGFVEFGDDRKKKPTRLRWLVTYGKLMQNIGKLAAADLILGNGDRVETGNFGNIMFDSRTGELATIDSSAILASFDQMVIGAQTPSNGQYMTLGFQESKEGPSQQTQYINMLAKGEGVQAPTNQQLQTFQENDRDRDIPAPTLAPVMGMSWLEPGGDGKLFERFRSHLEANTYDGLGQLVPIDKIDDYEWNRAKQDFIKGFQEGLEIVDQLLGGLSFFRLHFSKSPEWKKLKAQYKEVGYSAEDPNLSWYNLVIRRDIYIQLRKGKTMEQAIRHATELAAKKKGKMLKLGRTG